MHIISYSLCTFMEITLNYKELDCSMSNREIHLGVNFST